MGWIYVEQLNIRTIILEVNFYLTIHTADEEVELAEYLVSLHPIIFQQCPRNRLSGVFSFQKEIDGIHTQVDFPRFFFGYGKPVSPA
jgi:hypothetical protein